MLSWERERKGRKNHPFRISCCLQGVSVGALHGSLLSLTIVGLNRCHQQALSVIEMENMKPSELTSFAQTPITRK